MGVITCDVLIAVDDAAGLFCIDVVIGVGFRITGGGEGISGHAQVLAGIHRGIAGAGERGVDDSSRLITSGRGVSIAVGVIRIGQNRIGAGEWGACVQRHVATNRLRRIVNRIDCGVGGGGGGSHGLCSGD